MAVDLIIPLLYPEANSIKPSPCEGCHHIDVTPQCIYCGTPRYVEKVKQEENTDYKKFWLESRIIRGGF